MLFDDPGIRPRRGRGRVFEQDFPFVLFPVGRDQGDFPLRFGRDERQGHGVSRAVDRKVVQLKRTPSEELDGGDVDRAVEEDPRKRNAGRDRSIDDVSVGSHKVQIARNVDRELGHGRGCVGEVVVRTCGSRRNSSGHKNDQEE